MGGRAAVAIAGGAEVRYAPLSHPERALPDPMNPSAEACAICWSSSNGNNC